MPLKVIIAGAGLGGLGAAIAMARSGHEIEVYPSFMRYTKDKELTDPGFRAIQLPERDRCRYSHCPQRHEDFEVVGHRLT